MSRRRLIAAVAAAVVATSSQAQVIRTYTETQTGTNLLPYGLPVPRPIDSLTPVDGFRSYASLEARLQGLALNSSDLSAHDVGRTFNNRTVWAYVVSDEDGTDVEGRPEAAFFINASTHAREWGTPEVSTGTIERLIDTAGDQGWTRYLLDNTRLVIIPVHNIDGVLQAQRYPTEVVVGQDPNFPNDWPRDGRMRRKNMRGVDEILTTFTDHLGGVDLNRNHPPFWATSTQSSTNPAALTYHGTAAQSEPETQALVRAAQLGPETRFRLGIDVHTFSRVFFSSNTARTRLNAIQSRLIALLAGHHFDIAGKNYNDVPDPANRGIGAAAEYFAYQWLVPSWTLELEPLNDAREYGGTAVTHGGFILPASQARRVREGWAETHGVAFYMMAGPPHLSRLRIFDVQSGALALETRWQYDAVSGRRTRSSSGGLQPARRYRAELGFSKPMRRRNAAGVVTPLIGLFFPDPTVALLRNQQRTPLDTQTGAWINDPARVLRYRDDTFAFEFTAPTEVADYRVEVDARDMTSLALDSDPSTPADWSEGAWSEYEDAAGVDGDVGGVDGSATLAVATAIAARVQVVPDSRVVGEGDGAQLRLQLAQASTQRIDIDLFPYDGTLSPPTQVATWLPGETGERSVPLQFGDNLAIQGDRDVVVRFVERLNGATGAAQDVPYRVLDNDSSDESVYRIRVPGTLAMGVLSELYSGTPKRHLVLDAQTYGIQMDPPATPAPVVHSTLRISGNGATLDFQGARALLPAFDIASDGRLELNGLRITAHGTQQAPSTALLRNAGELAIRRSTIASDASIVSDLVDNSGVLSVERSLIRGLATSGRRVLNLRSGAAFLQSTTLAENEGNPLVALAGGQLQVFGSSLIRNTSGTSLLTLGAGAVAGFGHALVQDNVVVAANCDRAGSSFGFNAEDRLGCGFRETGDRQQLDLGDLSFSPQLGGYAPIGAAIDGGTTASPAGASGCGRVDQRGAPRPQTLTAGAEPRCDTGAIELGVNPYRGIWEPTRSGHGVDIQTVSNTLFLAWYTYTDDGQPVAYQAAAPLTGRHWEADLLQPRRDPANGQVTISRVGRVSLDFSSDTAARLGWRFDARGVDGSEQLRPSLFAGGEPRFEVTGLWYPPADSGYGATISRRGEATAIGIYYYDATGQIRWALGSGNGADAQEFAMFSYTGFCPDCDASQMPVTSRPAGTLLAHFHTPERARLDMQLTYPGAAGGQWNKQRASFAPLNDPVDNRYPLGMAQ